MSKYESIFIIDTDVGEEVIKETVEKITALISSSAKVENVEEWGKRKLAYEVDHKNDGYFTIVTFEAEPDFPRLLENTYQIDERIIKYNIINIEK